MVEMIRELSTKIFDHFMIVFNRILQHFSLCECLLLDERNQAKATESVSRKHRKVSLDCSSWKMSLCISHWRGCAVRLWEAWSDINSNAALFVFKFKLHPGMNKRFKALLSRYFCIAEFLMKALRRPRGRWESGTFELVTVSLCGVNDFSVTFYWAHTSIGERKINTIHVAAALVSAYGDVRLLFLF